MSRLAAGAALLLAAAGPAAAAEPARAEAIFGQLRARNATVISSELSAVIQRLPYREGQHFERGQALLILDCALQRAGLAKAGAELEAAKTKTDVQTRLFQLNSTGELDLKLAVAERNKAQAEVQAQQTTLGKCQVAAPFSGRVAKQEAQEHQFVQVGQRVLEIVGDGNLEIDAIAPSALIGGLREGRMFAIQIAETGKRYQAKVLRLGARVDPVSQSIQFVGEIVGQYPELKPGMSGRIELADKNDKK